MNAKITLIVKKITNIIGRVMVAPFLLAGTYLIFAGLAGGLFTFAFWDAGIIASMISIWLAPISIGVGFLRAGGWMLSIFLTYGLLGPKRK